ncbi:MAG: T9SS type A sorting domain-containing protein, partial [candidate division Zixibacteria bacterium]|nr:T9SS type A sorting domain-containing protein [candidate division Zixibacteria bacterium]
VVFRGKTDITDGYFDFSFIAPLDIGVGGKSAKISGYAISSNSDALGLIDSIPVSLSIMSNEDSEGPQIDYSFGQRDDFLSGDKVTSGETMTLDISDLSGINLTGSLGHEISLVIDDRVENSINLTDLFQYSAGSYLSGTIVYEVGKLSTGIHNFRVKAWDNANNSSLVEFEAEILASGEFMITELMNYPNPMRDNTVFSFSLSSPASSVNFEIFTLSGRKIKSETIGSVPAGHNEFYTWNGNDTDADRIATGVYIYKVTAVSDWYEKTVESFGKVVLIN